MSLRMKISLLSLNVRGLRNKVKRRSIFSFLKDQNCDIFFLQETFSEPKDESIWENVEVVFFFPTGQLIVKECLF